MDGEDISYDIKLNYLDTYFVLQNKHSSPEIHFKNQNQHKFKVIDNQRNIILCFFNVTTLRILVDKIIILDPK